MASLSEEMKNKRDVKRKSAVLVVDGDLGNYGLYMSILSMEYDVDCTDKKDNAEKMCEGKHYDAIIADISLGIDDIAEIFRHGEEKFGAGKTVFLVLVEPDDGDSIVRCLCHGAWGYIPKPFTKEGLSGTLYKMLKEKREKEVRHSVLIVDNDTESLCTMKEYLKDKYTVNMVNSCNDVTGFVNANKVGLIIGNIKVPETEGVDMETHVNEIMKNGKIPVLFMTDVPDAESVAKCAKFQPEGFLIKPIDKETLLNTLERIFLLESYVASVDGR